MLSRFIALTLVVLTCGIGRVAEAQPSDYRTYFTFSAPVTLPGMTLPAGKYLFRVANPDSSRNVINVMNADGTKSLAMLHTIPNQAQRAPKDAEVRFMETSGTVPPPVKTWWYPGKSIGYEFIYPRKQALELAKASKEPVLTTKAETTEIATADLSRVNGEGVPADVAVEQNPAPREATGRAQQGEVAGGSSAASAAPQDARADERARTTARTQLPRTAGSMPTVLLLGALALTLGLGLSRFSRARA
jgi:hypothetical protein